MEYISIALVFKNFQDAYDNLFSVVNDDFEIDISRNFPTQIKLAEWLNPLDHTMVTFQGILIQAKTDEPLVKKEIKIESEIRNQYEFYVKFLSIGYQDMEESERLEFDAILGKEWTYTMAMKLLFRGETLREVFMTFTTTFNT